MLACNWFNHPLYVRKHIPECSVPAYRFDQVLFLLRKILHSVALCLEVLQNLPDAAKDVQVGSCTHVALVGWEAEDCDGHLLLSYLLLGQAAKRPCSVC